MSLLFVPRATSGLSAGLCNRLPFKCRPSPSTTASADRATMAELLQCPFCPFSDRDSYFLMLHVEELHTDDSPFVARDNNSSPPYAPSPKLPGKQACRDSPSKEEGETDWLLCPEENCGEQVPLYELNDHLDLHLAETLEYQEAAGISSSSSSTAANMRSPSTIASEHSFSGNSFSTQSNRHARARLPSDDSEKTTLTRSFLDIIKPSSPSKKKSGSRPTQNGRLGKSELGPYAFEEQMPAWLYRQIEAGPKVTVANRIGRDGRIIKVEEVDNETPGILPVLAQLCSIDRGVSRAYLCHPSTIFITKRQNEGGFCGYRNTQMLVSYIQGSKAQGHDKFGSRTPGILLLQDMIEEAWDKGINTVSRTQTGGIRGTRKYIGTPEVEALLRSLGIDHGLQMFTDRPNSQAHEQLLNDVESYFEAAVEDDENIKVHKTHLPPIYLQQPGHSITIVGFERLKDGTRNLLVFDPMFRTSPGMHRILGRKDLRTHRPEILQAYRRGARQLSRHRDFEMIKLTAHPPLFPAWDV
ncbi:peptidase family C78-domain-containing protein [Phyllosticta citricarpa]|uniref:Peptidase family C78-domain-containing protein n=2 Tax=Phyllosticta TaxID=121621 RepID=A0ABR1LV71_9PEZI